MVERQIEINAPIQVVFEVIRNFKSYPEFVKGTKAVQERQTESALEVDFEIDVLKRVHYTLSMTIQAPHRVEWTLLKGELFKENSGGWLLESLDENKTLAHYRISVGFGWMVPKTIVNTLTETQLPEMLNSFKERAEKFA